MKLFLNVFMGGNRERGFRVIEALWQHKADVCTPKVFEYLELKHFSLKISV